LHRYGKNTVPEYFEIKMLFLMGAALYFLIGENV